MSTPAPPTPWQPPVEPPAAPQKRSRLIIVVLAVAAALIVAVLVVVRSGGDGGGAALDAETAHDGLASFIEDEVSEESIGFLDGCPLTREGELVDEVEAQADVELDLDGDALAFASGDEDDGFVACTFGDTTDEDAESAAVAAFIDPRGREFRSVLRNADGDVEEETALSHRGSTIERFCVEPDDGVASCTAGWSRDEILVIVSVSHDDIDADGVTSVLEALLDPVIETLEDEA
jgi:hypothetical protein